MPQKLKCIQCYKTCPNETETVFPKNDNAKIKTNFAPEPYIIHILLYNTADVND